MERILVATDGSPSSTEAVAFGVELAAEHAAELIIVHVVPTLDVVPATGCGIGGAFPHLPRRARSGTAREHEPCRSRRSLLATTKCWPCKSNPVRLGSCVSSVDRRVGRLRAFGRGSGRRASQDTLAHLEGGRG
jgi:universal stress protein family protein